MTLSPTNATVKIIHLYTFASTIAYYNCVNNTYLMLCFALDLSLHLCVSNNHERRNAWERKNREHPVEIS